MKIAWRGILRKKGIYQYYKYKKTTSQLIICTWTGVAQCLGKLVKQQINNHTTCYKLHNITLITKTIHTQCTQQTKAFPCKYDIKPGWIYDPNWREHINL